MEKTAKIILAAGLATALSVGSFAAGSLITISVDPTVKIKVNGEEFKPKDANGNDVMTFIYNGTTYAPLRALAEAYGLQVGYDAGANMATVMIRMRGFTLTTGSPKCRKMWFYGMTKMLRLPTLAVIPKKHGLALSITWNLSWKIRRMLS